MISLKKDKDITSNGYSEKQAVCSQEKENVDFCSL